MIGDVDYSYYGRITSSVPRQGFSYSMVDEHIRAILSKRGDEFSQQMSILFKRFQDDNLKNIKKLTQKIGALDIEISALKKKKEVSVIEDAEKDAIEKSLKNRGFIK